MVECSINFIVDSVTVETESLCSYINYHIYMFFICGSWALFLMLLRLVLFARFGPIIPSPWVECVTACNWWSVIFLCHMAGFEGALLFCYLCVIGMIIYSLFSFCANELWKATHVDVESGLAVAPPEETPIPPVSVIVVVNDCCICLESGSSADGQWMTSQCGHVFHTNCIAKWRRGTCPLCRKYTWM
jgi:hypothetical protein